MAATQLIKLNMKLAARAGKKKLDKILAEVSGIESVIQTFPDEADEELSRLYVLEVNASESEAAIKALSANPEIEYVEQPAPRRLVRKPN